MTRLALVASSSRGGLHYVRGALASPVCVAATVFGTCVGISSAGAIGALLSLVAIVGLCVALARIGVVRRYLDRQEGYLEVAKREATRLRQLRPAGPVRVQQYGELRRLVEEIEANHPIDAQRFELQDLLDHFARIAAAHYRCLDALRFAHDIAPPIRAGRRRAIHERRVAHRDACLRRVEQLADELEAIDELIRLCAQRVACPEVEVDLDREIDRRLWEFDEVDDAMTRLSA